jgi:hypothetical protein
MIGVGHADRRLDSCDRWIAKIWGDGAKKVRLYASVGVEDHHDHILGARLRELRARYCGVAGIQNMAFAASRLFWWYLQEPDPRVGQKRCDRS